MSAETLNFNSLIEQYRTKLRAYAMGFTHDEDDADDLIQDTLMKAFTYFSNFKSGTNFRAWLFTIMKNTFINNYRKATRTQGIVITEDDISANNLMHSATSNLGELKFINEDIARALHTLPPNLYEPFMKYFEGYKYHEIAEAYQMPVGTVKTRIHHARQQLKKYLKIYEI